MAKIVGKAPPPRGNKKRKNEKIRRKAFSEIAKEHPQLVENEEKRKELWNIINETDFAVDSEGKLKMRYKGQII